MPHFAVVDPEGASLISGCADVASSAVETRSPVSGGSIRCSGVPSRALSDQMNLLSIYRGGLDGIGFSCCRSWLGLLVGGRGAGLHSGPSICRYAPADPQCGFMKMTMPGLRELTAEEDSKRCWCVLSLGVEDGEMMGDDGAREGDALSIGKSRRQLPDMPMTSCASPQRTMMIRTNHGPGVDDQQAGDYNDNQTRRIGWR